MAINYLLSLCLLAAPVPDELLDCLQLPRTITDEEFCALTFQDKERWEFEPRYEEKKEELRPIFASMGYLDAILPLKKEYDYALIIGSTVWTLKKRIAYLEILLNQGYKFNQIIFLSSERPLLPSEKALLPNFQLEHEMARHLNPFPAATFAVGISITTRRSGTIEALQAWLQTNPPPGTCLAISNQPYLPFQEALLQSHLPFPVEITGQAASENWTVALLLDTIARKSLFGTH